MSVQPIEEIRDGPDDPGELLITPEQARRARILPSGGVLVPVGEGTEEDLDDIEADLMGVYAAAHRNGVDLIQDVDYVEEPDGGATIRVNLHEDVTPDEAERIQVALMDMMEELKAKATALKARQLHELRQKQATMQARDAHGRFTKIEETIPMTYGPTGVAREYKIPVNIYEGQATTLVVPAGTLWRQWVANGNVYTEAAAGDEVWARWGGWHLPATTSTNTYLYALKMEPQISYTTATYATPDNTWNHWVTGTSATTTYIQNPQVWERWMTAPQPSEADRLRREAYRLELLERDRRQQEWRDACQLRAEADSRRRLELEDRLEHADKRAQELLWLVLSPEQRLAYQEDGNIPVMGSEGGLYVVQTRYYGKSVHGNIIKTDEHGCRLGRICIAPGMRDAGYRIPAEDGFLGQILAIQHDEEEFKRVGNWSDHRPCQHRDVPILGTPARIVAA